jgi:gliding motility-associated lipoprotein GldH
MKNILKITILFGLMTMLFAGCRRNSEIVYEEYHKFDSLVWKRFDFQVFEIDNLEEGVDYDVEFRFRHLPEYPYRKFFFTLSIIQPDENYRAQEYTIWLKKSGKWKSKCMGDYCDYNYLIKKRFQINQKGTYKFEFENRMPINPLRGMVEVGLLIRKSPEQ